MPALAVTALGVPRPAGRVSVNLTFVAVFGPLFVAFSVHATVSPTTTVEALTVFVMPTSVFGLPENLL